MKRIQSSSFKKANESPHGGPCMKCGKDLPVVWGPSMCAECGKKHDEDIKKHKESKDKQPPMTPKMAQGQERPGGKIADRSLEAIPSNLQSIGQTIHSVLDQNIKQQLNKVFVPFNQQVMSIINQAKSQGTGFSPNYQARPETANKFVPQKMAQTEQPIEVPKDELPNCYLSLQNGKLVIEHDKGFFEIQLAKDQLWRVLQEFDKIHSKINRMNTQQNPATKDVGYPGSQSSNKGI